MFCDKIGNGAFAGVGAGDAAVLLLVESGPDGWYFSAYHRGKHAFLVHGERADDEAAGRQRARAWAAEAGLAPGDALRWIGRDEMVTLWCNACGIPKTIEKGAWRKVKAERLTLGTPSLCDRCPGHMDPDNPH